MIFDCRFLNSDVACAALKNEIEKLIIVDYAS